MKVAHSMRVSDVKPPLFIVFTIFFLLFFFYYFFTCYFSNTMSACISEYPDLKGKSTDTELVLYPSVVI